MLASLVDVFFPPRCSACMTLLPPSDAASRTGDLCALCESTLEPITSACARCGLPGESCEACLHDPPAFDGAQAAFLYGAAMAELLRRFKYSDRWELARPLGGFIAALDLPQVEVVAPIPLHASRRRKRTYDQALYLAQEVARRRGWRCESGLLTRVRPTPRQVGQSRAARALNMQGAFQATEQAQGRTILLVDDVVTTGATASECAKALKQAGARRVVVASVARAV